MAMHVATLTTRLIRPTYQNKCVVLRYMSTTCDHGKSLVYQEYGEPIKVLSMQQIPLKKPEDNQVLVKWLLAPVNPADINTIQGRYPSKPALPAVPGNEGVGEVVIVGSKVQGLEVGDRVVPNGVNMGTWRTHAVYNKDEVLKIPKNIGMVEASMINVNPCTAYRMLKDFVPLKPGDTVIQNGGNSAVGQIVIQLCKAWHLKSVSIVRDRPEIIELKDHLKSLGAHEVLTESELRKTEIFKSKQYLQPKLALNCICGQNALEVLRHLDHSGVMVTYGGMSRDPLTVPTSALIFKNITIKGFWMTAWTKAHMESKERTEMYNELEELINTKNLQAPPYKLIAFDKFQEAVLNALSINGKAGLKYILDMTQK
ncbi:enoyl-[acyl-carrier-protein] reductase, mitochondrial [Cephus cinctus]|uniref:Enoyl-[acyl-carrier-protein] reductase, mitochondrial n=1 Tax=Cephus cinctus TaxID=211228 RepID=A0AAJ7FK04_CEPCN|nr:enoyl-[acyl-carrier-protein] reductase, mitochondrial [Cephus cinctus]